MEKSDKTAFFVSLFLVVILSCLILNQGVRKNLNLFGSNSYYYLIYVSIIIAFVILLLKIFQKKEIKSSRLKFIYGLLFLPVALFPIIKCYFKVPYVFCKACPAKCPWGELRPFIIPSFVILNIESRFWCYNLCPFGTLQDYQCKLFKIRIKLPKWIGYIRYVVLLFTIVVVLLLIFNETFYLSFFKGSYALVIGTFISAILIFILSFFIPRFWCNYFCPIGSLADLVLKVENKRK